MLGESHSLVNEFPTMINTIKKLVEIDQGFARDNKHYVALDKEIRDLELRDSPISDADMQLLKLHRTALKDALYERLVLEQKAKGH